MKAWDTPVASSVLASRTARLLPRASITTTLALGRICEKHTAESHHDCIRLPNKHCQALPLKLPLSVSIGAEESMPVCCWHQDHIGDVERLS